LLFFINSYSTQVLGGLCDPKFAEFFLSIGKFFNKQGKVKYKDPRVLNA